MNLTVAFVPQTVSVDARAPKMRTGFGYPVVRDTPPEYDGPYAVMATDEDVVLSTAGKKMTEDVIAHPLTAFDGETYITPSESGKLLLTKGKRLRADIYVAPIRLPYADVSGVTAAAADVRQGKIIVNAQGEPVIGTLTTPKPSDVNFFDYDGTLLHSYSAAEFAQLSALPDNPTHDGLTAQGWNWTLADAKAQVTAMGACDIGQSYVTNDGATHIHIKLTDGTLSLTFGMAVNGTATVDWGDGSATDTLTGTNLTTVKYAQHTYVAAGNYVITVALGTTSSANIVGGTESRLLCAGDTVTGLVNAPYLASIRKVFLGERTNINSASFRGCGALETVTIPNTVTAIGSSCFYNAFSIKHLTLPISVTSVPYGMCYGCYNLGTISMGSGMTSFTSSNSFYDCRSLSRIVLHRNLSRFGTALFYICTNLTKIVIPSTITNIPASLFTQCYSITDIVIPSDVVTIGNSAFYYNQSLCKLTIPANVTSIGTQAFANCYGLRELHFKPLTPPTITNANAFTNVPTDCVIYVPTGKLNAYKTAGNYPSSSTYTYVEE